MKYLLLFLIFVSGCCSKFDCSEKKYNKVIVQYGAFEQGKQIEIDVSNKGCEPIVYQDGRFTVWITCR